MGVLTLVGVVAAAGLVVWWRRGGEESWARRGWEPPPQWLLSSSMRLQPVRGWRTSVADLGLPARTAGAADQPRIAATDDPFLKDPFIGSLDDRGYFLASSPGDPSPQWWLVGLDARDGRRLFAPVPLSTTTKPPECFFNGPTTVLCLSDDQFAATAWVIDTHTGVVSYTGPTELRLYPAELRATQVGSYLLAFADKQGVYGVGPTAEPTWFVPGAGSVSASSYDTAAQGVSSNSFEMTIFSLKDGSLITPDVSEDARPEVIEFYQGGFTAEVAVGDKASVVEFFDTAGKRTTGRSIRGSINDTAANLTIVLGSANDWAVFTPDGGKLLEVSGERPHGTRLIGSKLFVDESRNVDFPHWQPYDLRTGAKGKACEFDMGNRYLGTDGSVAVIAVTNPKVDLLAKAWDLTTCDTVWTVPSAIGSFGRLWRINTTLVQLSDDGTELFSLQAPS